MSFSLLARRVAKPVAARAFTTSAARQDFGWSKLVTPLTSPAFIGRMKEIDMKLNTMRSETYGVAAEVEPIDWAYWEKHIDNKQLLQQIRNEYENIKFEEIKGMDLSEINAKIDTAVERASKSAEISKAELPKVQADLDAAMDELKNGANWAPEDYFRRLPGLEEQLREEYMQGDFLLSDPEERLNTADLAEIRKAFRAPGADLPLPDDLPGRVGDEVFAEEEKKMQQMVEKMFGGAPLYEQVKAERKAAEAKKAAAAAH